MNGILLVDKPEGWTSHDVIAKLRGVLHERRIGHSGTLDPMATGLLVVFIGRATRAVEFAEADRKEYIAGIRLGLTTDTQDTTGNVLSESGTGADRHQLEEALKCFRGDIQQIPPMYSAIKMGGKKLYEIARKGDVVERKSRDITIHELELLDGNDRDWQMRVCCSKGTYIRTLCNDIGAELGTGAAMSSLRRTMAGRFHLEQAHTLEEIISAAESGEAEKHLLAVDAMFYDCPGVTLTDEQCRRAKCGSDFKISLSDGRYRAYSPAGEFLMLGKAAGGVMSNIKSFFEV